MVYGKPKAQTIEQPDVKALSIILIVLYFGTQNNVSKDSLFAELCFLLLDAESPVRKQLLLSRFYKTNFSENRTTKTKTLYVMLLPSNQLSLPRIYCF